MVAGVVYFYGLFVLWVLFEIEVFWDGVVFELLGVGGGFVLRVRVWLWGVFDLFCSAGYCVLCWGEFFGVRVGVVFELLGVGGGFVLRVRVWFWGVFLFLVFVLGVFFLREEVLEGWGVVY